MMNRDIYDQVQAALLNSEGDPNEAVLSALRAITDFVEGEEGITPDLREACDKLRTPQ